MTNKNVHELIKRLSSDLSPVNVYWRAENRALLWFITHATWICCLGLLMSHPGEFSLSKVAHRTDLFLELLLFFIAAGLMSFASFASMVPGRMDQPIARALAFSAPVALLTVLIIKMMTSEGHIYNSSLIVSCKFQIVLYSLAPIFHLYYMIRNGDHFYSKTTFLSMGMAAAFIPSALMHVVCLGDYKHVLMYHVSTIVVVSLLTPWAMKKALNRRDLFRNV